MSHTPGPWEIKRDVGHFDSATTIHARQLFCVKPAKFELMLEVGGWAPVEKLEANTRLIAAAPDLLEALETIAAYPLNRKDEMGIESMRELARTAIAKARGEG